MSLFIGLSIQAGTLYQLDFSQASGDPESWFKTKGWKFEENVDDMNLRFEEGKLVIEPDNDDLGVIAKEFKGSNELKGAKKLIIEWGVDQYLSGLSFCPRKKLRK